MGNVGSKETAVWMWILGIVGVLYLYIERYMTEFMASIWPT
jgi:hypothetical protein